MNYKRQYRQPSDEVRAKMSAAHAGKQLTDAHKSHISQSMKQYWQGVPNQPTQDRHVTMDELIGNNNGATCRQPQKTNQ